mmetsp:Transcript_57285/g.153389  ORF Transcript_57285/g.153389 Transcript_57285/m.153389 type:complete len:228 (+) Transcript_57285:578-1261(+)
MSSSTGRGGQSSNFFRCSSLHGFQMRSLDQTERRSAVQTTCRENLRLLLSLNSESADFQFKLSGSNCMGMRPSLCARFSSWITPVFWNMVTRLMATVGTSAMRIRRRAFARGGSIPIMSNSTASSLMLVTEMEKSRLNLAVSHELSMSRAAKAPQKSLVSGFTGPSAESRSVDCCSLTLLVAASCGAGAELEVAASALGVPPPVSRPLFMAQSAGRAPCFQATGPFR